MIREIRRWNRLWKNFSSNLYYKPNLPVISEIIRIFGNDGWLALVNPWTFPATTPHFGLLCIASYLRNHMNSVDISIIESEEPLAEIQKVKPDIVGITSNTEGFSLLSLS